jgi:TPR repeat protein
LIVTFLAAAQPSAVDLEARCRAESDGPSCYKSGFMYSFAMGVTADRAKAASLFERSCELDVWTGCHDIGVMYEHGDVVARDLVKAQQYYEKQESLMDKQCAGGNEVTCRLLKRWREQGLFAVAASTAIPRAVQTRGQEAR